MSNIELIHMCYWILFVLKYPPVDERFIKQCLQKINFALSSQYDSTKTDKRRVKVTKLEVLLPKVRLKRYTVYPKKYAHGFVVLCFVVVMQSFIMNSHEVFIHIHQSCFAGTGAIVRWLQCQWSKPDGYGTNQSMYNHNKAQQSKNRVHIYWVILYIQYWILI